MDYADDAQAREPTQTSGRTQRRFWELGVFGFAHMPLGALALPPAVFLPHYFATHLGIGLTLVSAIFFGARLFDIIIDPAIGNWQDNTVSRYGRRRLWFALAAPVLMFFVWVVFIGIRPGADIWLAVVAVFAMYALYATMLIAHLGWAGELRDDYHGRTRVLGSVQFFSLVAVTLVLLVPGVVRWAGWGDDADAVHIMGWMILAALPICALPCILFVREPRFPSNPPLTWRAQWQALATNAHLRHVLAPDFLLGFAQGVAGGLFLFYFQYALRFDSQSQILLFLYFATGSLGVFLWIWLGRKIGKPRALQAACVYAAAVTVMIFLIPPKAFWIAAPLMALAGLHQGAGPMLLRAMMADVIDDDVVRCGAQRSGLFYGLISTTSKVGLMMGPITYAILDLFAFDADLGAANTPQAMTALAALFIGAPALIYLLTAWSLRFYKLDETRQKALRAEIEARNLRAASQ